MSVYLSINKINTIVYVYLCTCVYTIFTPLDAEVFILFRRQVGRRSILEGGVIHTIINT